MSDCAHAQRWAPVSVVVAWAEGLTRPRVVPTETDWRPCVACLMLFDEVDAALKAKGIYTWTRAVVLFQDGRGAEVRREMPPQAIARA